MAQQQQQWMWMWVPQTQWVWVPYEPEITSTHKTQIASMQSDWGMSPEQIHQYFPQYSLDSINKYCEKLKFKDLNILAAIASLHSDK